MGPCLQGAAHDGLRCERYEQPAPHSLKVTPSRSLSLISPRPFLMLISPFFRFLPGAIHSCFDYLLLTDAATAEEATATFVLCLHGFKSQYVYMPTSGDGGFALRRLADNWQPEAGEADRVAGPKFDDSGVNMADYAFGHVNPRANFSVCRRVPARSADNADTKFNQSYIFSRAKMLIDLPVVREEVRLGVGCTKSCPTLEYRLCSPCL